GWAASSDWRTRSSGSSQPHRDNDAEGLSRLDSPGHIQLSAARGTIGTVGREYHYSGYLVSLRCSHRRRRPVNGREGRLCAEAGRLTGSLLEFRDSAVPLVFSQMGLNIQSSSSRIQPCQPLQRIDRQKSFPSKSTS